MINRSERETMLRTAPLTGLIFKMALPCMVSFLITSIYNLADTYFVSSLGTQATAAVSVNASLDMLIMMLGSFIAVGCGSLIARLIGAGDKEKASSVLSTGLFTSLITGSAVLVFGLVFMRPLVRLLGATDTCEAYSIQYATYVLLVAPFMTGSFVFNQCLRAEGSAMLSMIGMGFGGVLNCVLDPIFIFTLGLGVKGASMATAISKFVSFCILLYPYASQRSLLKLSRSLVHYDMRTVTDVISVGSSALFRTALSIVASIILNNLAGEISDSVLASIGVTNKVMMFPFGILLGYGQGVQPVTGFNWGAGDYKRVRDSYKIGSRIALIGAIAMSAIIIVFAKPLMGLFTETDADMLEIGALAIRLQCIAMPIHAWIMVINMFCVGMGRAKEALILATSRQGSCFLPIVYPMYYFLGSVGLASVQAAADVLALCLGFPIIKKMLRLVDETEARVKAENKK